MTFKYSCLSSENNVNDELWENATAVTPSEIYLRIR